MDNKDTNSTCYELFTVQGVQDEKDQKIQDYLKNAEKAHGEDIKKFKLWVEYLKRSDKFRNVCKWFEEARSEYSYPPEPEECKHKVSYIEDYLVFANNYKALRLESPLVPLKKQLPIIKGMLAGAELFKMMLNGTFFLWAVDAGYPKRYSTEMLMNLFVFGNVFNDPEQVTLLRILNLIESKNKSYAYKLGDVIDVIFKHTENDPFFLDGREPNIGEYKQQLKRFFDSDFFLNVSLLDPYENKDKTIKTIKDLIDNRRAEVSSLDKEQFEFYKPDQFEWPTGNLRIDELNRYLKVFDLKKQAKMNKKIAEIIYPGFDPKEQDTKRRIARDHMNAKSIIANVEQGFFPGKYPN